MKKEFDVKSVLALVAIIGFFEVLTALFTCPLPKDNSQMANTVIVALIAIVTMIVGYYFGSSAGSAKKTDLLNGTPPPGTSVTETLESGGTRKETVTNTPPTGAPTVDAQKGTHNEEIPDSPPPVP